MYINKSLADFFNVGVAIGHPKADNQNSHFTSGELESVYSLVQPYVQMGHLLKPRLENSFGLVAKQSFIMLDYKPLQTNPPRLAFLIQKTLNDDKAPGYEAQFNIHTQQGWLQTTRFQSLNFPVIVGGLRECMRTNWSHPERPISLIQG